MAVLQTTMIDEDKQEIDEFINDNHAEHLNTLVVLDNLGFSTDKSPFLTQLFQHGRHRGVSIINIIHELFSTKQLKSQRGLTDYFHCYFLMGSDVENLITQIYGKNKEDYDKGMTLYKKSQQKPYGYLVIDISARPSDKERWENRERISTFFKKYPNMKTTVKK